MFRLRLLGAPCIAGPDDRLILGPVTQRHRLALLALLALAPEPGMSRDQLMGYLWPERDTGRGRHLLKQAIYVVRGALGPDAIRAAADRIGLNADRVRVDVIDFESALARADPSRAVTLYRGPFLDGFFLSDAPEFDRWMEGERERLASACGKALEGLAEAAEAARDLPRAVDAWRAVAAHEPYDSRVALRLMVALEAEGNPAAALQIANAHMQRLQEDLGAEPPAEIIAYAERLRVDPGAPPRKTLSNGVGADARPGPVAEHAAGGDRYSKPVAAGRSKRRRFAYGAAALAVGAVALTAVLVMAGNGSRNEASPGVSASSSAIAVLPLANRSTDPADAALADGMTREIINVLGEQDGMRVSASTSVFALRGRQLDVRSIAESLQVSQVLEGDLQRSGSHLRMHLRLIDARDGLTRWSGTYDRDLEDIFAVQNEIADAIARELGLGPATRASASRPRRPTRSIAAYELYLRGSDPALMRTDSGALQRLAYFRQAVALDPRYAAAFSALAITYIRLSMGDPEGYSPRRLQELAETSAARAVALDDSFAEAHITLAQVRMRGRQYRAAEEQLRRAIELDPTSSHAYQTLAGFYLMTERAPEGLAAAKRALTLDSLSPGAVAMLAHAQLFNRRCGEAREQLQKIAKVSPPLLRAGMVSAECYAAGKQWTEAIAALEPQARHDAASLAVVGYLYGRAGHRAEALRIRRAFLDRWHDGRNGAFQIAISYAGVGEMDEAFTWIDRALDDGSLVLNPFFGAIMEPIFEELRADPRFAPVRQRLGLPGR